MKNLTIIIILILMTTVVKGQNNSASGELFHPNTKATNYKPGEILVKFKDNATIIPLKSGGMMKTGVAYVDSLSMKWGITGIAQVFRNTQKLKALQIVTLPDGKQKTLSQVFNIYKITFPGEKDAQLVVDDFKKLANVDYAELNGTASIVGGIATSEPFYDPASAMGQKVSAKNAKATTLNKPNDPLYNQQWYIPEIKADSLWNITTGDTTQVIGILDTGVDWHHPDLANKIWINTKEIPNNGIDDDGNGYIDDVRGWDFVNNDNNPMDDNSHGTHCAGIAAAETNNGIGIAGVSWGAKVMPIKVFQSNGIGYFSQIAEGFWYAAKNGCTIFSNSWSSTGESITIRLAMEYAYSKGLIVAAAGNMNTKTDQPCPPWPPYEPNFPACYNWVLGVEATDQTGNNAWFSNFDPTGPIISDSRPYGGIYYNDFDYNYEMRAPGVSFMSTVPNGQYRSYSGTSMACPLVAGSIALMKSYDPKLSNEQVFAKLIQTIKISKMQAGVLNILKCTLINPPPDLYYVKNSIADSLNGGDNDGRPDAGETIDMHITVKNAGGKGDSIYTKIRFSEFEDKSVAKIIKTTCFLGNLSAYAKQTSLDAIKIKIDSNVVDARIISFQLLIYQKNSKDTVYQNLTISVEHGIEIKRTYSKLHLTGNAYYLVTEASVIDSLIIDPGVTLRFKNNAFLMIIKYMYAVGNPENMITFKGADDSFVHSITMANNAYSNFSYCIFQDGAPIWNTYLVNPTKIYNSIFRNNSSKSLFSFKKGGDYQYNVFTDNSFNWSSNEFSLIPIWELATFKNNILASNTNLNKTAAMMFYGHHLDYPMCMDSIVDNVFLNNEKYSCSSSDWNGWPMGIYKMKKNYWGTTNLASIKSNILDFYENSTLSVFEPEAILNSPPESCHGLVWKVEINNHNPQDIPINIGTGPTKFSVFFNRSMDPKFVPFLTFGVRFPYTQNSISDSAKWSADHKVFTAYKTIDMSTGDGDNTVRVAAAKDMEHFEIPIERNRFKFVVQAASSQSVDFIATPGIGKVKLEWPLSDSPSVLGYNMYRYTMPTASTYSDTLMINKTLITDSLTTDFNVVPGTTYHYMFTAVRTNLSESDYSKTITATPLKAANGDANGDLAVNVLDIMTIVSYLLNNNPQPFIAEAADLNNDGKINVLDVVGVVNKILNPGKAAPITLNQQAHLYMQNDTLFANTPVAIGGIQFDVSGVKSENEILNLKALLGFESASKLSEDNLRLLYYSLSGKIIPAGNRIPLLKLLKGTDIANIILSDNTGNPLFVDFINKGNVKISENLTQAVAELGQNYPNPANNHTVIPVRLYEPVDEVVVKIFNVYGQTLEVFKLNDPIIGEHLLRWIPGKNKGLMTIVLEIRRGNQKMTCPVKKMIAQ